MSGLGAVLLGQGCEPPRSRRGRRLEAGPAVRGPGVQGPAGRGDAPLLLRRPSPCGRTDPDRARHRGSVIPVRNAELLEAEIGRGRSLILRGAGHLYDRSRTSTARSAPARRRLLTSRCARRRAPVADVVREHARPGATRWRFAAVTVPLIRPTPSTSDRPPRARASSGRCAAADRCLPRSNRPRGRRAAVRRREDRGRRRAAQLALAQPELTRIVEDARTPLLIAGGIPGAARAWPRSPRLGQP